MNSELHVIFGTGTLGQAVMRLGRFLFLKQGKLWK
jgi:hypothetical protein